LKCKPHDALWLAQVEEWTSRNDVEAVLGASLFVSEKDARTIAQQEFGDTYIYFSDLVGLTVINEANGETIGVVDDVMEMPAQPLLQIVTPTGQQILLPYVQAWVPQVNLEAKTITVILPDPFDD
jgi:16S rRNA processing protein RimM